MVLGLTEKLVKMECKRMPAPFTGEARESNLCIYSIRRNTSE